MKKITKKRKLHRLIAWLLSIAMLSGYVPQGASLKGLNLFKNMGKVQAAATLQNPRIVKYFQIMESYEFVHFINKKTEK